jgi:tetratricopeptide (TPR) repeat protein
MLPQNRTVSLPILFAGIALGSSVAAAAQTCTGFQHGSVGNAFIYSHFSPAVFSVAGVGTAYLVDAEDGYLITATHVIADVAAAGKDLTLTSVTTGGPSAKAHQIQQIDVKDVTLLQLDQPDAFKGITPIDISFSPPDFDTSLFVMGYPVIGDQAQPQLRSGAANLNSRASNGLLEVAHVTAGGSSGGPLFNGRGEAIATCHEELDDEKLGRYVATGEVSALFKTLPVSKRMKLIEGQLASGGLDQKAFALLLQSPNGPSNLELYVWLQHVAGAPSLAAQVKKFLSCPIEPAIVQRGIAEAILFFIPDLTQSEATEVQVSVAQKEHALGHNEEAYTIMQAAEAGIASIDDPVRKAEVRLLQGNVAYELGLNYSSKEFLSQAQKSAASIKSSEVQPTVQANLNGMINSSLGKVSVAAGKKQEAIVYFNSAINNFGTAGAQTEKFTILLDSARTHELLGDYSVAIDQTKQAVALANEVKDPSLQSEALMNLGTLQVKSGNTKEAVANFQKAHQIYSNVDSNLAAPAAAPSARRGESDRIDPSLLYGAQTPKASDIPRGPA